MKSQNDTRSLARFSWLVLAWTTGVILWGALVRATGSGAGCGEHWPLCDGKVIPLDPGIATVIEFTHRLTSGLNLILVIAMTVWVCRRFQKGAAVRKAALASTGFILIEALIGAVLVLLGLVENDQSSARAVVLAFHLANTFLLLASLALTAFLLSSPKVQLRPIAQLGWFPRFALALCLVVGVSGGIAALGDTLFPATGLQQGLSASAHVLLKLRLFHPALALVFALVGLWIAFGLGDESSTRNRFQGALGVAILAQVGLGFMNIYLHAPVWIQIVHLFMADLTWVLLVCAVIVRGDQPKKFVRKFARKMK